MKGIAIFCVVAFVMVIVCGCGGDGVFGLSNENIANRQMNTFLDALERQDTESLMSLFAPNALSKTEDVQDTIDFLYSYYQGKCISYDNWDAVEASTEREGNHIVKKMYGTYDVVTDAEVYRFAFLYIAADSSNQDNVGLWSVYIIKMDDDIDPQFAYRGDDLYTPGIQIGIRNKLPDEID